MKPGHEYHGAQNSTRIPALKMICEDAHFASTYKTPHKNKVTKVTKTKTCKLCGGKSISNIIVHICVNMNWMVRGLPANPSVSHHVKKSVMSLTELTTLLKRDLVEIIE